MEKIYHSLTELIGRTPLLEISHIEKKEQLKARVLVKLETRASDLPGLPRSKVTGSRSPCLKP